MGIPPPLPPSDGFLEARRLSRAVLSLQLSKAGREVLSLCALALFNCPHHKLDTHKAQESQTAGEGDAQGFILRNISLACLFPVSSADKAAGGSYVLEGSLPLLASPGQEGTSYTLPKCGTSLSLMGLP